MTAARGTPIHKEMTRRRAGLKQGGKPLTSSMHREIREQPEVLGRIMEEEWKTVHSAARALRDRGFRLAVLVARGTSDNAAYYAKYLFEVLLGVPTVLASPSTFTLYGAQFDLQDTLDIGVSQSGESKNVLESIRRSRELGAVTLSITNDGNSPLAEAVEHHFLLRAGEEKSVAATKTYTAELLLLYLLVIALRGATEPGEPAVRLPKQAHRGFSRRSGWTQPATATPNTW